MGWNYQYVTCSMRLSKQMVKTMKMYKDTKLRVGMIDFTNGLIPDYELELAGCEKIYGLPATLNQKLRAGELDVSPVSSMEYFLNHTDYQILPSLCIRADSRAATVGVFSCYKPEEWGGKKIYLTGASLTSIYLLKLLCKAYYEVKPNFVLQQPECVGRQPLSEVLKQCDGMLLIGDQAYNEQQNLQDDVTYFDLASAWRAWTDLPFVFALWIVRNSVARSRGLEINKIHSKFLNSIQLGLQNLDKICDRMSAQWVRVQLKEYFQSNLRYDLDSLGIAGLLRFRDELFNHKLINDKPPLTFFSY